MDLQANAVPSAALLFAGVTVLCLCHRNVVAVWPGEGLARFASRITQAAGVALVSCAGREPAPAPRCFYFSTDRSVS